MEQWALVLADSVLLVVALAGAVFTLVRRRRAGGFAAVLAGAACGVLVVAAVFDMLWWTQIYPNASDDTGTVSTLNNLGILGTFVMISIGVGLLIASTNVGRSPAAAPTTAPRTINQPAVPAHAIPQQAQYQQAQHQQAPYQGSYQAQHHASQQAAPQAQPAPGWTPPQQAQGQPDWNIHSGVWSIPRGTFDGPPPDQQQR